MADHKTPESENTEGSVLLRIVGGPAAGREFSLPEREATVGRSKVATVAVPDNLLSRTHARIYPDGGSWYIEDLDSTNGTWIRGERISAPRQLPMQTIVSIGSTLLELSKAVSVEPVDDLDEELISARVRPVSLEHFTLPAGRGGARREQLHLAGIYRVQSLLATKLEEPELYHRILEIITDVVECDAAYLLRYVAEDDLLIPVSERNEEGRVEVVSDTFISRSITNYVKHRREGILSVDARRDERFQGESLCGFNAQSVMCVPMLGRQELCGLIYLINMQATRTYDGNDLKLLTHIAQSAGLAVENSRLLETNIRAERMAAIGMTAASLSHYVKNILTGLEGSISLLRVGIDDSDSGLMNEAWDILSKNHRHLSALVLDLLNLAREDALEFDSYNVSDIIYETVELARSQTRENPIEIDLEIGSSEPVIAEVDSRGLHRVLLNLINNAVDAVEERHGDREGGKIKVAYRVVSKGQILLLEVSDNGIGIPEDRLKRVFEMFHSGKGERGTGLGLAVSKRIVDGHRGVITVGSEPGVGTSFIIKLPMQHQTTDTDFIRRSPFSE